MTMEGWAGAAAAEEQARARASASFGTPAPHLAPRATARDSSMVLGR